MNWGNERGSIRVSYLRELLNLNQSLERVISLINNRMVTEVLEPGAIWGRVQGVGSGHWGTRSLPSLALQPRAARTRAKRAF